MIKNFFIKYFLAMTSEFLRAYSLLSIKTCHKRGIFAMGGMAAQIPIKHDQQAHEQALAAVRADKEREANDGWFFIFINNRFF